MTTCPRCGTEMEKMSVTDSSLTQSIGGKILQMLNLSNARDKCPSCGCEKM